MDGDNAHDVKTGQKNMTLNKDAIAPVTTGGRSAIKKVMVKQQIKLLIGKTTLAGQTKVNPLLKHTF